jgi:hypothetical protein
MTIFGCLPIKLQLTLGSVDHYYLCKMNPMLSMASNFCTVPAKIVPFWLSTGENVIAIFAYTLRRYVVRIFRYS